MSQDTLTVTDNRTGQTYVLPIEHGTIRATDVRKITTGAGDNGLAIYDPALRNTACCRSSISFVDHGIHHYRGYPIELLAENYSFLEVAYLLLFGELPHEAERELWKSEITHHTMLHETSKTFMEGFLRSAHPMGMLVSTLAAFSTIYPEARDVHDLENRLLQIKRIVAKVPSIAAMSYRHNLGYPYVYPDNDLSYTENFMNMLWKMVEPKYLANMVLAHAFDVLFILHADDGQNCSATTVRCVGSADTDPYLSTAAAAAALAGPLHGGMIERIFRMLNAIRSPQNVPAFIKDLKEGRRKLVGFDESGSRDSDPRTKITRRLADQVFEVTGKNRRLEAALELERIAREDDFFVTRRLHPNLEFYTAIIYQAMGFRPEMVTVLQAIPRTVGWLAHWQEMLSDPEHKIAQPTQVYTGRGERDLPPLEPHGVGVSEEVTWSC
ncbi:MAG TPA: citrate/2-methylcitrate synthase [Terriglobales bacterium]|nr:citrate/2-methylcitrate synthase [Terriglobales bacterium]